MGQTLPHGVYLPDNGERNCYVGLSQNWQKLDNLIGSHGDTVSFAQTLTEGVEIGKITINGVDVSLYHTDYSDKADADNVYTKAEVDSSLSAKANASDLTTHTNNTDIHVTTSDKAKWNGKQDALSSQQIANINDVVNKANDGDVVHKSGDETISGVKTFDVLVSNSVTPNGEFIGNGVLGTTTNKWKTINGINPGALSLPKPDYIDVDTTDWDLTCQNGQLGSFIPTTDGWLMLQIVNSGKSSVDFWIISGKLLRINSKSTANERDNVSSNMFMIPVIKGKTYNIFGNASEYTAGRKIGYCVFMPCQGNV